MRIETVHDMLHVKGFYMGFQFGSENDNVFELKEIFALKLRVFDMVGNIEKNFFRVISENSNGFIVTSAEGSYTLTGIAKSA